MADNEQTTPEFDSGAAVDMLLTEAQAEEPQQEQQEQEISPEEARKNELRAGLNSLYEDDWTPEEIEEFSQDALVREDIQKNGKTVRQAARAYMRRQAQNQKSEAKPAKHGVPTTRTASNSGADGRNQIETMSDKEFDAFYKQTIADSLAGKKHRL